MRIVFMGTPDFAVKSLEALAEAHEVVLVVTRPDAVRGRGKRLEPSAVKAAAQKRGLSVLEAKRVDERILDAVRAAQADVICVAAYGAILPDAIFDCARLGCINVHASLLPRWRGAAPIQRAVLEGDERAGISIMRITHELDAGAYCKQASLEIGDMPCQELMEKLGELGGQALVEALGELDQGTAVWHEQDESQVSFAPKITKEEMRLDPADSAEKNKRRVQASLDAAPARFALAGKGVRALEATLVDKSLRAGEVEVSDGHIYLGCKDGALELLRVKPDGKKEMLAHAWAQGLHAQQLSWSKLS
ncbi:MAG: methionyl-tRNA formyltransferase [Atopobiaceae bacterium]|jgi:methionyl-tRNA formyltransferase